MRLLLSDTRYALRVLWKDRGVTAMIVVTLALGIGANTGIFTLLDAVMLRPLSVREPGKLVLLKWKARQQPKTTTLYMWAGCPETTSDLAGTCSFSFPMYKRLREDQSLVDIFATAGPAPLPATISGQTTLVTADFVSPEFFDILGVPMSLGRPLETRDDLPGAQGTIVLGNAFWKKQFGGDSSVIGRTILIKGITVTIVGVAPPTFQGVTPGLSRSMWVPFSFQPRMIPYWPQQTQTSALWVSILGRLRRGVTAQQAQSALTVIFRRAAIDEADKVLPTAANPEIELQNAGLGLENLRSEFKTPLMVLTALVAIILLIACANVAGLMLVRAVARERETAVRLALGARQSQIFQQLLTEGVILTALGASLGMFVAYWISSSIAAFLSANVQLDILIRPDSRILLFTLSASILTGLFFSLTPGFASLRTSLIPALKLGGTALGAFSGRSFHHRVGKLLVVAQVALSAVGLAGAGLLVRTLINLETVNTGFDTQNVLTFSVETINAYKGKQLTNLFQQLQTRFASLPEVASATYSMSPLLSGTSMFDSFHLPSNDNGSHEANIMPVGPEFFETMRIPLVAGRAFTVPDMYSNTNLAVVNQDFVKKWFGRENPIGKHFIEDPKTDWEIVGVAGDAKYDTLRNEIGPTVYLPLRDFGGSFSLRTAGDSKNLIPLVRSVVAQVDPNLPLNNMRTIAEEMETSMYQERLVATLSSMFALVALLLASLGLYGLLSYDATRRTHEIGTRIALGARRFHVVQLVVDRGIRLAAVGLLLGLLGAIAGTRFLGVLLYGVKPVDPLTFLTIGAVLLGVAAFACYIPAHRASNVDPMVALRCE